MVVMELGGYQIVKAKKLKPAQSKFIFAFCRSCGGNRELIMIKYYVQRH